MEHPSRKQVNLFAGLNISLSHRVFGAGQICVHLQGRLHIQLTCLGVLVSFGIRPLSGVSWGHQLFFDGKPFV